MIDPSLHPGLHYPHTTPNSLARVGGLCVVLALCSTIVSCGGEVRRRDPGVYAGDQGSSAALVFNPIGTDAPNPDASRRDLALNSRLNSPVYPLDAWPDPSRPSLARSRQVNLSRSSSSFIYFQPQPDRSSTWFQRD